MSDPVSEAVASHDLYWWHRRLITELAYYSPQNEHALADNLGELRADMSRWLDQLLAAGMVELAGTFDYPARWFRVTELGEKWAGE